MTIISEALLAIGIIMVSMAFVLVGGNIISFQTEGLFKSTENQMTGEISNLIREIPESSEEFSTTFEPEIDSYTLQVQENRTITVDVPDAGTSSTEFLNYRIQNTLIRNSDEICIQKKSSLVSLKQGSCDSVNLSNFCANGRCVNNVCQPAKGETCANSGGDCRPCSTHSSSSDASDFCQPDYKAPGFLGVPGAGDGNLDTVDNQCINETFIGVQDKGDRCSEDFECGKVGGTRMSCSDPVSTSSVSGKYCCPDGKAYNGTQCETVEKIHLVYVPLNQNTLKYDNAVSQQGQFVKDEYPINPDKIKVSKINDVCNVPINPSSCTPSEQSQTLHKIEDCVSDAGYTDYDLPVGIFQEDVCGSTAGFTHPSVDASTASWQYDIVSAHEMGHQYRLNDEYLDACRYPSVGGAVSPISSNCLEQSLDGDRGYDTASDRNNGIVSDNADFCAGGSSSPLDINPSNYGNINSRYTVWCRGNQNPSGGRDIMSSAGAPGPREFAQPSLNYLKSLSEFS